MMRFIYFSSLVWRRLGYIWQLLHCRRGDWLQWSTVLHWIFGVRHSSRFKAQYGTTNWSSKFLKVLGHLPKTSSPPLILNRPNEWEYAATLLVAYMESKPPARSVYHMRPLIQLVAGRSGTTDAW